MIWNNHKIMSLSRYFLITWDEPGTLNNYADFESDISHYRVCYNLSTRLTCTNTTDREFIFLKLMSVLIFCSLCTAVNLVGEGNGSTVMHWACDSSNRKMNMLYAQKFVVHC